MLSGRGESGEGRRERGDEMFASCAQKREDILYRNIRISLWILSQQHTEALGY